MQKIKIIIIILVSCLLTLLMLYSGKSLIRHIRRQTMLEYAKASSRSSDGAANLVILNGEAGNIAGTPSCLRYLKNGSIEILAKNSSDSSLWKQLSKVELMPGIYTLTGLSEMSEGTIELLLSIEVDNGKREYYSQYDEDILFSIRETRTAQLYLHVYPFTEITTIARPAIYKEEE